VKISLKIKPITYSTDILYLGNNIHAIFTLSQALFMGSVGWEKNMIIILTIHHF